MVTFGEVLQFDPEQLDKIFRICTSAHGTCTDLTEPLRNLDSLHTWQGPGSEAARGAAGKARVDIDTHGQEVAQVAAAARDCYGEGVTLKSNALAVQQEADRAKLRIDPATGRVSDPNPPLMLLLLTAAQRYPTKEFYDYAARIAALQQRVNDVISAAGRFDEDLAALINGADGTLPLTPPNSTADDNEIDRRANQIAAFRAVYHRDPVSENDWRMAEALDPHTYDPKYRGMKANIVMATFDPVKGLGLFRQNMYIPAATVDNLDLDPLEWFDRGLFPSMIGDNRGPSANAAAEASRVSLYADMDNGVVIARQNPTMSVDGKDAGAGRPSLSVVQGSDGSLRVNYHAVDPFEPAIAKPVVGVSGEMTVGRNGNDVVAGGHITQYPSTEAYQYKPDGETRELIDYRASTSPSAPASDLLKPQTQVGTSVRTPMDTYPSQPTDGSPLHPPYYYSTDAGDVGHPPKAPVVEPYSPPPPSRPTTTTMPPPAPAPTPPPAPR
ncbi:hypothetical protein [Nocardia pseudobrasiliensis]|uniref:Uncharacterized protein n=1 Tax=Nocardia pseudobrasiliensis TaxID=45979 RepID=A0A370IEW6_9NOCA|nr:hypothetical protein [Nocardia pseudobrasiliensis]RDI69262.1 hypothetical protein DFR76_101800 [Nocardia pseudobrasiliensis]